MAKITRINPEGIAKPFSNYSHVVTAEGAQKLVFCAGQVAADADGKVLPPDDFDAQAKMVMENLDQGAGRGRRENLRRHQDHDLSLQSARRAEGAQDPADLFRRSPSRQHALHPARARQSQFPSRDRGDRGGVTCSPLRSCTKRTHAPPTEPVSARTDDPSHRSPPPARSARPLQSDRSPARRRQLPACALRRGQGRPRSARAMDARDSASPSASTVSATFSARGAGARTWRR